MSPDGGLRPLFRARLPQVHWTSVETGGTGRGVADSHGCCRGASFWVEFKKTSGWVVPLSPEQVGWLESYSRAGGRALVAVRRKNAGGPRRGSPVDELWVLCASRASLVKSLGLRACPGELVLGAWGGGPARWDWGEVLRVLVGPGAQAHGPAHPGTLATHPPRA